MSMNVLRIEKRRAFKTEGNNCHRIRVVSLMPDEVKMTNAIRTPQAHISTPNLRNRKMTDGASNSFCTNCETGATGRKAVTTMWNNHDNFSPAPAR